MGEETGIAWCDSTFNPVIGCMKVSAGCDNCFAEALMDTRYGRVEWGQRKTEATEASIGTRVRTSPTNWRQPVTWNRHFSAFQAKHGHRQRVFCASLSDVFDTQWEAEWRLDLWKLIHDTPQLDWLLLTKRPENIERIIPTRSLAKEFPNVWIGTTAEDQAAYDRRWPILSKIEANVRFISYEPAIGSLSIDGHRTLPDWIIAGGESGKNFRPANPEWFDDLRRACKELAVPFFMKQMSGVKPNAIPIPEELLVRQFPPGSNARSHV